MFLAVFPPDKYTSVKSTGLLEFTCSHHVYCITAAHKVYMHRKNVLKPQRSRYVNKSRPALVAAHGLASHTFSQPQSSLPPPPCMLSPASLCCLFSQAQVTAVAMHTSSDQAYVYLPNCQEVCGPLCCTGFCGSRQDKWTMAASSSCGKLQHSL